MEEGCFAQDISGFRKMIKMEGKSEGKSAKDFTNAFTHKPPNDFIRKELSCPSYRWGNLLLEIRGNFPKKYSSYEETFALELGPSYFSNSIAFT